MKQVRVGIFGYGEVGHGLALGLRGAGLEVISAYQRLPHSPLTLQRAAQSGVRLVQTPAELAEAADLVLAVTQGSEVLNAARAMRDVLRPRHCYVDLASATPGAKKEIGALFAQNGVLVADGAIEGSPLEHQHRFPVIVSGPGAAAFAEAMTPWGMRITVVGDELGRAAAIKGLRHILTKGQIALLIECAIAAKRYGIRGEVLASVAEWYDALPFMTNASRVLRTTTVHAARRAEEAAMAQAILEELGVEPVMTRSIVKVLEAVARLNLREQLGAVPPQTFEEALDLMEKGK